MRQLSSVLCVVIFLLSGQKAQAQADMSMATHWYNRANYNPASIVRTDYIYLFTDIRQQWVGIDGAPKVFNVQGSEYIHDMNAAFGLSLVGEKIGVTQAYNPMVTYAYRISDERDWSFAMGLSAGVFARLVNGALYEPDMPVDPSITYSMERVTRPDANVGFEFQTKYLIASISSTHILSINKPNILYLNTNTQYGSLIYKNSNPEMFNFHVGMQVVNRYNLTVYEGNVSVRFKRMTLLQSGPREIFDLGFTYRSSQQMTLLFALNISRNLRVGYAFEQSFITGYNVNGTHELMMEFRIPSKAASAHGQFENQEYWYH